MHDDAFWEIIDEEYKKLKEAETYSAKLNLINTVILLKQNLSNSSNCSLYADIRKFLEFNVYAHEESHREYYLIKENRIDEKLALVSDSERDSLLEFFIRELKKSGFEDISQFYYQKFKLARIKARFKKKTLINFLIGTLQLSAFNLLAISLSILVLFIILYIVLLPCPNPDFILFRIDFNDLHNNFFINHLLNILVFIFGLNEDVKVTPISSGGVLLGVIGKIVFYVIVINFLITELLKRIKIE